VSARSRRASYHAITDRRRERAGRSTGWSPCELANLLADAVRAAQDQGEIDPEADADAVADALLAISRGIDVLGHGGMPRDRLERAVEAALIAFTA
jgi:hypothetical protein